MHVLLVDDSPVSRLLLRALLEADGFRVSEVGSGQAALDQLEQLQPDLISMDLHMPGMGGLEATRRIMQRRPTPIAIVTAALNASAAQLAMQALAAGALMVIDKPVSPSDPHFLARADWLLSALRQLAQTLVRRPGQPSTSERADGQLSSWQRRPFKLVAIGASAGGPAALAEFLSCLAPDCPWPILLVQHISPGFSDSLRDWLASHTRLTVQLAQAGEVIRPGQLYLAPDAYHLRLDAELGVDLDDAPPQRFQRPSIDVLFDSLADSVHGEAIAILLSGMGSDGAQGLAHLKALGALTLVQAPDSAVVDGMPRAALALDAACLSQTPAALADSLNQLMRVAATESAAPTRH